jgi:hypothetical protein
MTGRKESEWVREKNKRWREEQNATNHKKKKAKETNNVLWPV